MPERTNRPCTFPNCPALVKVGRCAKHARQAKRESDSRRLSSKARGYGAEWQRLRELILRSEPLCRQCRKNGAKPIPAATDVDHIKPREDGGSDDPSNLQPLCKSCHSIKTATEDGGFGNAKRHGNGTTERANGQTDRSTGDHQGNADSMPWIAANGFRIE